MDWYIGVLKQYAVFDGRSRRAEYWYFVLFNALAGIGLALIDNVTGTYDSDMGIGLLGGIYSLAVLLPTIGVSIRRLHVTGRSGWWLLMVFIPLLGAIVLIVFLVMDSDAGENQYGPNPKTAPPEPPVAHMES